MMMMIMMTMMMMIKYREDLILIPGRFQRFFFLPKRPDQSLGTSNHLFIVSLELFRRRWSCWRVKLATYRPIVSSLVISGFVPPGAHTPSWNIQLCMRWCFFEGLLHLRSQYSDSLRAGWYGDRIPMRARCSPLVQTGPGAHSTSYTMGTGSLSLG